MNKARRSIKRRNLKMVLASHMDIVKETDFPKFALGFADRIWGLAGKDLDDKDLTNLSLDFLAKQTFDQNTR